MRPRVQGLHRPPDLPNAFFRHSAPPGEATMANDWNKTIIDEFRANGGRVGGQFAGAPLLLLHSVGAKSGTTHVTPLVYQDLGRGRVAVFASKAGAPTNPDWYHNLVANPRARVEIGTETFDVMASVARGEERLRIYTAQKQRFPNFAEYERKTKRQIPVVILERAGQPRKPELRRA
jgi:deazaflavin-dependent oxidoreductase (nitroreductase family)